MQLRERFGTGTATQTKDNGSSPGGPPAAPALQNCSIPLFPSSSLQWIRLCFKSTWACQAADSAQIWAAALPPQLSASSAEGGCVPPHRAAAGADTWRHHLEEHRCLPETPPSLWRHLLWASVRTNKLKATPAYPQTQLKSKMCNRSVPIGYKN